ncbi:unnamed protein product, partial [Ectocarpus sp. 12 AP-2014]
MSCTDCAVSHRCTQGVRRQNLPQALEDQFEQHYLLRSLANGIRVQDATTRTIHATRSPERCSVNASLFLQHRRTAHQNTPEDGRMACQISDPQPAIFSNKNNRHAQSIHVHGMDLLSRSALPRLLSKNIQRNRAPPIPSPFFFILPSCTRWVGSLRAAIYPQPNQERPISGPFH